MFDRKTYRNNNFLWEFSCLDRLVIFTSCGRAWRAIFLIYRISWKIFVAEFLGNFSVIEVFSGSFQC